MKVKRLAWFFGVLVLLAFTGLVVANLYDYFKFRSAIYRVERLTEAEKLEIGDFCRSVGAHSRFQDGDTPASLRVLSPIRGTLFRGSSDVLLYELGEIYLWVRVSSSASNQEILYFTNSAGPQRTKIIWNRNPEFARRVSPAGRLVTIAQWGMRGGKRWIVLEDKILVVETSDSVGSEDVILASRALEAEPRREIIERMNTAKKTVGGSDIQADGVMHGLSLSIRFTSDGVSGSDDISAHNTSVEEIAPLLASVSKFGPDQYPIEFEKAVLGFPFSGKVPVTRRSLSEWEKRAWPTPKTPWWSLWRKFFN